MLDPFKNGYDLVEMTDRINKVPFIPGQASVAVPWSESGIATTSLLIEEKAGVLTLISPSPRGGPGSTIDKQKRTMRSIAVPHYQIDGAIYADEVQGVRAFGSESDVDTVDSRVNEVMAEFSANVLDPSLELQRLGALKGIIVNSDTTTTVNLFDFFGVTQPTEVDFNLDSTANDGSLRETCNEVWRTMQDALGAIPLAGIRALCSKEFFAALVKNAEVRATYQYDQNGAFLRTKTAFGGQEFGDIEFREYRGSGSTLKVAANKCHLFPTNGGGLYRTVYAPADYKETVNTKGLPRYAKVVPWPNDKGVSIEMQTNPLSYCTRPGVLIQGKTT